MNRHSPQLVVIALVGLCMTSLVSGQDAPVRKPGEDVNSPDMRNRQGLRPDEHLLFNGWGVTPAGKHVATAGDLALKMIIAPDHKRLVAVTGGFNHHGLSLID